MDTIKTENVKVPNSVLVSGLTGDKLDNEVLEYLAMFGSIQSRCGVHLSNEPNYDLVEIKRNQFKQKQKTWEKQNKHDLN
ncbi:uncharacterized protein LOC112847669 [Tachysurus ichikawai]